MNKILVSLFTLFLSLNVFAAGNSYCEGQKGKSKNVCYVQANSAQEQLIAKSVKKIRTSLSGDARHAFEVKQRDWEVQINNGCHGEAICVYESRVNRNRWLDSQRRKLGS